MQTIVTPQPQLGDDAKVGHGFSDEGGDDESHRGLSKDSITPSLEAALRLKHQVSRTKVQQQTQVARDLADKCDGKCVVHARIFSAEKTDHERLARIPTAVDKSDSDSDEDDESFKDEGEGEDSDDEEGEDEQEEAGSGSGSDAEMDDSIDKDELKALQKEAAATAQDLASSTRRTRGGARAANASQEMQEVGKKKK